MDIPQNYIAVLPRVQHTHRLYLDFEISNFYFNPACGVIVVEIRLAKLQLWCVQI